MNKYISHRKFLKDGMDKFVCPIKFKYFFPFIMISFRGSLETYRKDLIIVPKIRLLALPPAAHTCYHYRP
ncbi:MAG: hypothetical protein DB853_02435 [Candidatus Brocadia sp.]|nr:MAG: hypothetical protein DB853_02435 [Candidatus Brocadia sp.]